MSWYVIRRKSTGKLLPAPPVHRKGGQTHVSIEHDTGPPRLFPTAAGANVAMKLWLRGDWIQNKKFNLSIGQVQFSNSRMHLADDMEVIEVEISLKTKPTRFSLLDD